MHAEGIVFFHDSCLSTHKTLEILMWEKACEFLKIPAHDVIRMLVDSANFRLMLQKAWATKTEILFTSCNKSARKNNMEYFYTVNVWEKQNSYQNKNFSTASLGLKYLFPRHVLSFYRILTLPRHCEFPEISLQWVERVDYFFHHFSKNKGLARTKKFHNFMGWDA
mgnify:CR=1 FL=1